MREPDFKGVGAWKAWRSKLPPEGTRPSPDQDATLAVWLVHCPGAHLGWSYWWITLVHLRPIAGVRPADIHTPGASYEVACVAQNPDVAPDPDRVFGDDSTCHWLTPVDWVVQFGSVQTDKRAIQVIESAVEAIMTGRVSPDRDYRSFWKGAIRQTAECMKGTHEPS